ncbi:BCCT family transporter, partial [Halomonas sp. 707D4]|nr:BCCT family transporter [Halomonas sp. 707D4]
MPHQTLRPLVFWPTFLILLGAVVASYLDLEGFLVIANRLNASILENFSWLFSLGSLYLLIMAVIVYASPLG